MKCDNCAINVTSEFTFAIKNNQCPACGKNIMQAERLASYLSLQTLLGKSLPQTDAENIANLIVANFEVRQMFKEEPKSAEKSVLSEERVEETVTEEVEEEPTEPSDEVFKQQQRKEAKEILKKMKKEALGENDEQSMRDEALTEALAERLGNANGLVLSEEDTPITAAVRAKMEYEKERQRHNVISGSGGAFRRST